LRIFTGDKSFVINIYVREISDGSLEILTEEQYNKLPDNQKEKYVNLWTKWRYWDYGTYFEIRKKSIKTKGAIFEFDDWEFTREMIRRLLLDWNFTDENGQKVKLTQTSEGLDDKSMNIVMKVDATLMNIIMNEVNTKLTNALSMGGGELGE